MMIYMGEPWEILRYLSSDCAGKFNGKEMGWFQLGKLELIPCKVNGMKLHMTYRGVWESNPLQPYQLVSPE